MKLTGAGAGAAVVHTLLYFCLFELLPFQSGANMAKKLLRSVYWYDMISNDIMTPEWCDRWKTEVI